MWGGKRNLIEFIDKTTTAAGTSINRQALMAIQGFITETTAYTANGVTRTNSLGQTLTTVVNSDGSVTETFTGDKTITRTIKLKSTGWEVALS